MRALLCMMMLAAASAAPAVLAAQSASPVSPPAPPSDAQQIAAAVLPLPAEFRANAVVLGYRSGSAGLVRLREGSGPFVCLADDPAEDRFHVACYHQSLEPFMARGRALRAEGVTGAQVDTVRFAEVKAGTLPMPTQPAALFSISAGPGAFEAATGAVTGGRPLFVVYIPGATTESTGLSAKPAQDTPWLMYPGTPKAHIMFVPSM